MEPIVLETFRPGDAGELAGGIVSHLADLLGNRLQRFEQEFAGYVADLAKASMALALLVSDGSYDRRQVDIALHTQELLVSNALLRAEFLTYELAQSVLETIFKVVAAAIKNLTGLAIKF